jgi:hypothetical protein
MKNERNRKCLLCGRPTIRMFCLLCAARLRREALRNEIEDEKEGKKPLHLHHS